MKFIHLFKKAQVDIPTMTTRFIILYICTVMAVISCKKPYTPAPILTNSNYLVVEGVINTTDTIKIKLSRTARIADTAQIRPEQRAQVTVESDQNTSYPLTEGTNGQYISPPLNLSNTNSYRLRIKTANGESYLSDFTPAKVTPPIDSITWQVYNNQLRINANTHDPLNNTRYYRWDFVETYEFNSLYLTPYVYDPIQNKIVPRSPTPFYTCWTSVNSSTIAVASTAQLAKDVVAGMAINYVPPTSEKVGVEYSIQAKQYALTADAFNYWQSLKKNTEDLGTIFDALPSQITGNIHCLSNPAELVIGYISAGTVATSQHIFITKAMLPASWSVVYPYACQEILLNQSIVVSGVPFLIVSPGPTSGSPPEATWNVATPQCADCMSRGRNTPPAFWK
jgi:hypothetical protein